MQTNSEGLYILLVSVHGLIRGSNLELGRDADTGGQTKYVVELAQALARHPQVERVDLLTRQVYDPRVSEEYSQPQEDLGEGAFIIRLPCGPRRYLSKEVLWRHLDAFADEALKHLRSIRRIPHLVHGHYADAGYVAAKLSSLLGVPMVFTGHSLGRVKKERLLAKGMSEQSIEKRYNIRERIDAEEVALSNASLVVTSTRQEVKEQYEVYQRYRPDSMEVIPPGIDLERYHPPSRWGGEPAYYSEIIRFLRNPRKPMILSISRADERKNIATLVKAYAETPALREIANLVIVAGGREDIRDLEPGAREVWSQLLMMIDRYDLHGSIAYPKKHTSDDVPGIYQIAARSRGVFVNPALTEPFGLTLLEAAASGLPVVATNDGGPADILSNCQNGRLIDPLDSKGIAESILEILGDRPTWNRLSRNGLRGVRRHYSWDGHAQTYIKKVKSLMSDKKTKPFWVTSPKKLLQVDRLLITDIDNTLLGDPEGLRELIERIQSAPLKLGFGIATGRHIDSARQVLEEWKVPRPDLFITSVGAEIHFGEGFAPDEDWVRHIDYKWQPDRLREFMERFSGVALQPESNQRRHKISYFLDASVAPSQRELIKQLRKEQLFAKIILSHGQFLDLLPIRASKGLAAWYLANKWGLPLNHVLVSGDSGNDEEMIKSNVLAVVVGNYSEELASLRGLPGIYFAEGHYARGILEGIDHYRFLEPGTEPAADFEGEDSCSTP